MGKEKATTGVRLRKFVQEFGASTFSTDGQVLLCRPCGKTIAAERKSQVQQHLKTSLHNAAVQRSTMKTQSLLSTDGSMLTQSKGKESQFFMDLCNVCLAADIPFHKLNNPHLRQFLSKYTKENVPSESCLRKNYLPICYEDTLQRIRTAIEGKKIWVCIDESRDAAFRSVGNVIIGTLEENSVSASFLLNCEELPSTNHTTIAQLFENSMKLLWPDHVKYNDVLLLLSDAAPYMIKAAKGLQTLYPKMLHLTCLAHGLHRVCEEARSAFKNVDMLIANVKKVFLKSPARINLFHELEPELPLPPQPVITRWGTWVEAVKYYSSNFERIHHILKQLDPSEAASIAVAAEAFDSANVKVDLIHLSATIGFIPEYISQLESNKLPLVDAMSIVEHVHKELSSEKSLIQKQFLKKLETVLQKNPGYEKMKKICQILNGTVNETNVDLPYLAQEILCFKYAPLTSAEVERSFSRYNSIFRENRQNFTMENLRMFVVVNCNL